MTLPPLASVFSANGPIARVLPGYTPRNEQIEMAGAIAEAIYHYETLICEAGTGVGKTFAYLVPAILSGKKTIVSTGTKNLQDQLFHRDLPVMRKALGVPVTTALLKGRANYLCLQRLDLHQSDGRLPPTVQIDLMRVVSWSKRTRSGDIAELTDIPENSRVWPLATSTADNCLGQECTFYENCYVLKNRREALEADLVVVNHHLFLADMALREEGFGEVLPGAEAVIFDEAHQLPELAAQFFGLTVSSRQLLELTRDATTAQVKEARDAIELRDGASHLEKILRDFRLALGLRERRGSWQSFQKEVAVVETFASLNRELKNWSAKLDRAAPRGKLLEQCAQRAQRFLQRLMMFANTESADAVQWLETFGRGFSLHVTPLDVAKTFSARLTRHQCAWVFTSATLAIGENFKHFTSRLGIAHAQEARWGSPYDYANNALLYLPGIDHDPRERAYSAAVVAAAAPVLEASQGRAFMLFTSYRAMQESEVQLRERLPFPLLVQGTAPKAELLAQFRRTPKAVLLGVSSFWEGVDVRGEALSLVIIDKLPFTAPDDPITQARIEAMRVRGQNPFMDFQIPEAVVTLKQGVGRLIRDERDRGVMMLCDPRLLDKSYGRIFLAALPPMRRTQNLEEVRRFFAWSA